MSCCFGGDERKADAYRTAEVEPDPHAIKITKQKPPSAELVVHECPVIETSSRASWQNAAHVSNQNAVSSGSAGTGAGIRNSSRFVEFPSGENAASGPLTQGQSSNINEILRLNLGEVGGFR